MDFKTKLPNVFSIVAVHIFASMRNTEKKRYLSAWCHGPRKVDFSSDSRQNAYENRNINEMLHPTIFMKYL